MSQGLNLGGEDIGRPEPALPGLPLSWRVHRLKHVAEVMPSNVDKHARDGEVPIRLCNYTDVYYNSEITDELEFMTSTATPGQVSRFGLRAGDTVVTKDSETANDIAIPAYVPKTLESVVCGYHLAIIRPKEGMNGRFLTRMFESAYVRAYVESLARGLTRVGLRHETLKNLLIPVPPKEAQDRIVAFLDLETARIDELVREQERLLQVKAEQTEARTESILWGQVSLKPARDWCDFSDERTTKLVMLRFLAANIQTGPFGTQLHAHDYVEDGVPVVNPSAIGERGITLESIPRVDPNTANRLHQYQLRARDVVLGRRGQLGRCFAVDAEQSGWLLGTGSMRIRTTRYLLPEFAAHVIRSRRAREYLEDAAIGSTMSNLNPEIVRALPVPHFDLVTQHEKVAELEELLAANAGFVDIGSQQLVLLRERRSALITAAVTGQLDLSDWRPPDDAALGEVA